MEGNINKLGPRRRPLRAGLLPSDEALVGGIGTYLDQSTRY